MRINKVILLYNPLFFSFFNANSNFCIITEESLRIIGAINYRLRTTAPARLLLAINKLHSLNKTRAPTLASQLLSPVPYFIQIETNQLSTAVQNFLKR